MAKPKNKEELEIYKEMLKQYEGARATTEEIKRAAKDESDKRPWKVIKEQMDELW